MVSDRALHVSSASFCKADEGITQEGFFFSSSFLPLVFIFCGATLHGLLWLLALHIKKKNSGVQSFLSQICKIMFVLQRCQETFEVLKIYINIVC